MGISGLESIGSGDSKHPANFAIGSENRTGERFNCTEACEPSCGAWKACFFGFESGDGGLSGEGGADDSEAGQGEGDTLCSLGEIAVDIGGHVGAGGVSQLEEVVVFALPKADSPGFAGVEETGYWFEITAIPGLS